MRWMLLLLLPLAGCIDGPDPIWPEATEPATQALDVVIRNIGGEPVQGTLVWSTPTANQRIQYQTDVGEDLVIPVVASVGDLFSMDVSWQADKGGASGVQMIVGACSSSEPRTIMVTVHSQRMEPLLPTDPATTVATGQARVWDCPEA